MSWKARKTLMSPSMKPSQVVHLQSDLEIRIAAVEVVEVAEVPAAAVEMRGMPSLGSVARSASQSQTRQSRRTTWPASTTPSRVVGVLPAAVVEVVVAVVARVVDAEVREEALLDLARARDIDCQQAVRMNESKHSEIAGDIVDFSFAIHIASYIHQAVLIVPSCFRC